jgi:hypothetical protein
MSISTTYSDRRSCDARHAPRLRCATGRCNGEVIRHSLGCGLAVGRCTRCFARYDLSCTPAKQPAFRQLLRELITWREED